MLKIGRYNELEVVRTVDFGMYLSDGEQDVLLPIRQVPADAKQGDLLTVFVYTDSEDRPIATMLRPQAVAGGFALMSVVSTGVYGAFVDWGLEKDLLVPHAEQRAPLHDGQSCMVRVLLDQLTNRVIGSTKLHKFLSTETAVLRVGQRVEALFAQRTKGGLTAIIDDAYAGAIFDDEIFEPLEPGDLRTAYVKRIREDGRLLLSLSPQGHRAIASKAPDVLTMLKERGGFLPYGDSTSPDEIRAIFGMSKSSFKKLIGGLKKDGKIELVPDGMRLKKR